MNWLTYQLALMPAPDVILHIGAGLCSELPDYQQIDPGRIILIEPSPETFNALRQKTADCGNVTVLQAAVAAEAGRARLRRFNFPKLDSLREPTGLHQLLPGLQQIGQAEVSTISATQLVRRLNLADSNDNWLILEAPGEEIAILEGLNRIDALHHFSRLIVRTGAEPFYKGDSSAAPLLDLLESFGYFAESAPDKDDPDWPRFNLKYQPLALKCRELESQLEESQHQLAETTEGNRAKAEEADALKSRIAELEKERDKLDSTRRELSEQVEASARKLDQAKAEWDKERQALEQKKSEEVDALNSRIEELEKQRHQLESARRELAEQAKASAHELESANQQRTRLEQKLEEKWAQAEKLKKSAAELKTAKEHYERLATEQSRQLEERQKQHTELDERQRLLDTEVQRAEAQIDLIKDVLIREKNF